MPKPDAEISNSGFQEPPKNLAFWLMGLLLAYVIARSVVAAATKPFWFDELLTLTLSSLPTMKELLGGLSRALDGQPPGFYLVERNFLSLFQNKQIALRMASVLAFPCTLICVFVYVKRRSGEAIGFIFALFLLLTSLFHRYAVEGRPYSMVMACIAFALVCYQRVPSGIWTAMMGLALALGQNLHYYSIFFIIPFGLAEAVYFLRTREFRWAIWLAMAFGALPLAFFWPLLTNVRSHFGTHFYEIYGFSSIPGTYGLFFQTDSAVATAMVVVSIAGIIGTVLFPRPEKSVSQRSSDENTSEAVLLLSFVLLPLITYTIVRVLHGGMRDAYVLASVLGVTLALAGSVSLARPGVVALFGVFIVFTVAVRESKFWRSNHSLRLTSPTAPVEKFIEEIGYTDLPVVISSGMKYTPLAYYATPRFSKRLFYLTDEGKQFKYQGADTFDKNVVTLRDYMPLQVVDYSEFTAGHRQFLLYTEEPDDAGTWLPIYLSHEAASMRAIAVEPVRRLYLVTMKDNSPP